MTGWVPRHRFGIAEAAGLRGLAREHDRYFVDRVNRVERVEVHFREPEQQPARDDAQAGLVVKLRRDPARIERPAAHVVERGEADRLAVQAFGDDLEALRAQHVEAVPVVARRVRLVQRALDPEQLARAAESTGVQFDQRALGRCRQRQQPARPQHPVRG